MKVYECHNAACVLGTHVQPGRFSGGISAGQVFLKTGTPPELLVEGKDFGEGFCPHCGAKGKPVGDEKPKKPGKDPYAHHHEAIAARVADPDDPLDAAGAQAALTELVEGRAS